MLVQSLAQFISKSFVDQKFFLNQQLQFCSYFSNLVGHTQEEVIDSLEEALIPSKGVKWYPKQPQAIKTDQVDLIKNMVLRGYSFLLDSSPKSSPFLDILDSVAKTMNLPIDCMDFKVSLSAHDGGFGLHFDRWDSIQFHLFGRKTWRIETHFDRDTPIQAEYWKNELDIEPSHCNFENFSLSPGDTFFVPAGAWHKTQACSPSCTIILRIKNPLLYHLVTCQDHITEIGQMSDLRTRTYECWKNGRLDPKTLRIVESIMQESGYKDYAIASHWPWTRSE